MRKAARITLLIILLLISSLSLLSQTSMNKRVLVKIYLENKEDIKTLDDMALDFATHRIEKHAEVIVTQKELEEIHKRGFKTELISNGLKSYIVENEYRSNEEISNLLNTYHQMFPDLTKIETIGYSESLGIKIQAIKISYNPEVDEDEPTVMYNGMHHAREPVGAESCLTLIEYLLNAYGSNQNVTRWVENYEIWIIPTVNTEGWDYLYNNNLVNPWWRKNLKDNNGDNIFNPLEDGVDLNRNYHNRFFQGGDSSPDSWVYRGKNPFSESETQAIRDLAQDKKFVCSISYHSYGEIVLYPWSDHTPADQDLLIEMVENIAGRILKVTGNTYYNPSATGYNSGMSMNWMYAKNGTIEFIIETCDEFMPVGEKARIVAQRNLSGALYLLERMEGPGITGTIKDSETNLPLAASVKVVEHFDPDMYPRKANDKFGRYNRLLQNGSYTLEFSKDGYISQTINNVVVKDDEMTQLNVILVPGFVGVNEMMNGKKVTMVLSPNYPNPFSNQTTINYELKETGKILLSIYDISGKEVCTLINEVFSPGKYTVIWDG
ncbi:M14 family zinc carboxypeptidase, partial [Bacteroidota bacterium]